MISFFVLPVAIIVGAAVLVLLLEAAGTPIGFRKAGRRTQLVTIALCAIAAAIAQAYFTAPEPAATLVWDAFRPDRWGYVGTQVTLGLTVLVMVALVPAARGFGADRGEVLASLLIGAAGTIGMCIGEDFAVVSVAMALQGLSSVALVVLDRRTGRGAEAAFKAHFGLLVRLLLWGMGSALVFGETGEHTVVAVSSALAGNNAIAQVGAVFMLAALFTALPLVPFASLETDVGHGASSFAGAQARAGSLIGATFVFARVFYAAEAPVLAEGLAYFVAASFTVGALAAMDQRDLDRAFAHLFAMQGAVVLAQMLTHTTLSQGLAASSTALVGSVVSIAGVATARGAVVRSERLLPTWERWSGVGRKNPYFSLALLVCAGSLVGLPGTAGFWSRLAAADSGLSGGQLWVAVTMVLSGALASLVIVRLGFFLFAKSPDPRRVPIEIGGWRTMALLLSTALVLGLGLGAQWVNAALERFLAFANFGA